MLHHLDARAARRWGSDALQQLGDQRATIDGLNVYPVPDGDTGTNLYLTVESAVASVAQVPDEVGLGGVADAFARGALLGAKGNSGVILSQLLRGWADVLGEQPEGGPHAVRAALSRAAEQAYAAVSRPVEGTMLTVARAAAQGAERGSTLREVVGNALHAARAALAHTPDQLEALRRAGVVDAGGQGLLVLFESLATTVGGRRGSRRPHPASARRAPRAGPPSSGPRPAAAAGTLAPVQGPPRWGDTGPAYEVMYLLDATDDAVPPLRARLDHLGESLVVVGGGGLWNVHVHTDDIAAAVEAGLAAGRPHRLQVTRFADQQRTSLVAPARPVEVAVLAGAAGPGLARLFRDCGAQVVPMSDGGRPSPDDLLTALKQCAADVVIVLPNDPQTLVASHEAAARIEGVDVVVLPTRDPVQGLAAVAVHDPASALAQDLVRMSSAAAATRDAAVQQAPGGPVGTVGGVQILRSDTLTEVACQLVTRMLGGGGELLTVVTGTDPQAPAVAHELVEHLRRTAPQLEVSVVEGGQDGCLLLGLE